jgi:hypothetical protein
MKWLGWCAVVLALGTRTAAAQLVNPTIEVMPELDSATVGDSVPLRVRLWLDDSDLLLDSVPRLAGDVPRGLRILTTGRLARQPDRTFAGKIVVAFYRTGRREVPPFAVTYRRNVSFIGATIRSVPAPVEVRPVLPAGSSPRLQDIKGLAPAPGGDLVLLGGTAAVLAALLGLAVVMRRHRHARAPVPSAGAPIASLGALDAALERLRGIEREQWPARGEVTRHYEAVVTVLRDYLAESAHMPARESTTAELLAALPVSLTPNGTRERLRGLLHEADLVKFARVRPASPDAERFLHGLRELLTGWRSDAVR